MTRNKTELYNTSKYQAVFPSPDIGKIVSEDTGELIISPDSNMNSASGNQQSSITMNASAGIWYDTGIVTSYNTIHHVVATDLAMEELHTFDKDLYRSAKFVIQVKSSDNISYGMHYLEVIHNDVGTADTSSPNTASPWIGTQANTTASFDCSLYAGQVVIKVAAHIGAELKGYVTYIGA